MKKWNRILPVLGMVLLLVGCGKKTAEMTTIEILKDGSIRHTMVEEFGEGTADALQSLMEEKVAAYNSGNSGKESVKVDTVKAEDGSVMVVMTYPDADSFDGFMNMDVVAVDPSLRAPFFYGTVEEALMQGYDLEITLQSVGEEGALQGKSDLLAKGESTLIIYDNQMNLGAPVQISLQNSPAYVSDNVTVVEDKLVEVAGEDKPAYILLEN